MAKDKKKIHDILTRDEYEALLAFHDIVEDIVGSRFEKIVVFSKTAKKSNSETLDVLVLLKEIDFEDINDIELVAEDLTENVSVQIAPLVMDEPTYKKYTQEDHPLIHDIQNHGVEFTPNTL